LLEAAHAAEERLSELVRQLDAIVWEADPQTRTVTFVSSQVKEWVGCEPEEWLGDMSQNFGRFVHPDDRERVLDSCVRAAEHGADHALEYRILKKNAAPAAQVLEPGGGQVLAEVAEGEAEVLWVRNIAKVEQREGVPVRMHGLMLDITARKRDSDLLHQNEEKFRAIFEGALDAMLILDDDARLVEVNAATGKLLGAPAAELPGRAIEDFVEPRARKAFKRKWRKYLERGQARGEFRLRRADGSLIQVEFASRADFLPGRHGVVVRDISQRKATDATLHLLERAVEVAGTGILMLDALAPGHPILYVNEAWEHITGRAQEEALGQPFPEWNGFESGPALSRLQAAVAERRASRETLRKSRPDGRTVWTELSLSPVRDDKGTVTHFIVVEADISERREAEETVRQTNAILQATQEAAADGIFLVDESGSVVSCNRRFEQMWQIPEPVVEELRADDHLMFYILSMMADPDEFLERIAFLVAHPRASTRDEVRLNDGRIFERYSAPAVSPEGHTYGRVWSFSDITERKSTEHQLRHQAFHDALTGLPNRAYFMDTLTRVLTRARRATGPTGEPAGETVAVLFLDLDRFKIINDSLGHETGDQLLIEASRRLQGCLRPGDLAARFGGDEFTVLLNDVRHISDATRVAERIADVLTIPFELSGHEVFTTTSVGIVLSREGGDRAEDLLRDADVAMYRAKNAGRARYEIFDSEMSAQAFERLRMEIDLRQALKRDQLRLHYQPLIGLSTGRIIGAEALVRWQHPEKGLIRPKDFIELAEESGMIFALGSWVLRTACAQAQAWSQAGLWGADGEDFHISVNVSAKQFHGPNLEEEIIRALAESQLEPRHLNLEITESVMLSGGSLVAQILTSLRKLGVQLAIDDFGTGFSSLSYLKKFPLDTLKIDRSFISASDLLTDEGVSDQQNPQPAESQSSPAQDMAIVEAVHALGRALKMTVVAEGVETEEQARHLRDLGCEIGQGYFFARPMPPEEFGALLLRNPTW
jgi:diguanylate cyclase (GGDEF)-like protein/PAS domain S-box-containing protein